MQVTIRVRMSAHDAHYGGNLVDGAKMLELFGDVATELLIRRDGDEGLFCAYDMVEFKAPVYAGDFIEATGEIVSEGNGFRQALVERKTDGNGARNLRNFQRVSQTGAVIITLGRKKDLSFVLQAAK